MILPWFWTEETKIPNLDMLVAKQREQGGALVEYQHVWSLLVFSRATPRIVWVPPGANRSLAGLRPAAFCAVFGWWSAAGFFWTISALIKNLMGGVDVTAILTADEASQAILPSYVPTQEAQREAKSQARVLVAVLFMILAGLFFFLVLPSMKRAGWI